MTNSSGVCECGHKLENHEHTLWKELKYEPNPCHICKCKKFKPQTPPTLKDLEYYSYIKSEYLIRSKDFKESLKRLRDEIHSWKETGIKDGNIQLMITNGGYINKFEIIKLIDEIMGVWE
jgi:hypothetical protein